MLLGSQFHTTSDSDKMWNCQLEKKFGTKRYYTVSMGYIYIYYHY